MFVLFLTIIVFQQIFCFWFNFFVEHFSANFHLVDLLLSNFLFVEILRRTFFSKFFLELVFRRTCFVKFFSVKHVLTNFYFRLTFFHELFSTIFFRWTLLFDEFLFMTNFCKIFFRRFPFDEISLRKILFTRP